MELYFLRHGPAGQHGDPKYKDDSLRPLTAQGREKMQYAALGMKNLGLTFDAILSSPYVRARQTAEITAQAFKIKNNAIHYTENLLPPATIEELLREVQTLKVGAKSCLSLLLVGHEPHLTEMISSLLKSNKPLVIDLKKGGLCSLTVSRPLGNESAVLNWLLTPAQLNLFNPAF
jgi:phosphohistidine phosphatase